MTATGLGAILSVLGTLVLLLGPYLARSQVDFLSGLFQLNLGERGTRLVRWSYLVPGAGLLLVGVVLVILAQMGLIKDAEPFAFGDGANDIFTAVIAVFMGSTFLLTLVLVVRLWRRGWPGAR